MMLSATEETYNHMSAGWSWAFDTPFDWFKQNASRLGGINQNMVVMWPDRIKDNYRSKGKDWADPIVGLRGQWNLNEKWYLAGKGDIGGFGVNSDFTWELQGTVGYNFTPCFSTEIGYRYFDTDYDNDGFTYDVTQAGILLNFNFTF
jgi:hypothetical protein